MSSARSVSPLNDWSGRLVPAGLVTLVCVLGIYPMMDTDFWWHLRTGQLIWQRGTLPRTDWYLFTDSARPWIDLHYGFQLLIAGLYALGGVNPVIVFKALVIAAAVGVGYAATGKNVSAWCRGMLWIPPAVCMAFRAGERPEILSLLFLSLWLWMVFRAERQPRWLWWLPLLQVVWINCHALFVLGLVVGACFVADVALRHMAGGRFGLEPVAAAFPLQRLLIVGGLCGLAALANPYGLKGALWPLELYRKFSVEQEFYAERVFEFERPWRAFSQAGFSHFYLSAELLTAALAGASLVLALVVTRRWSPLRWLLFGAFGHLGWEAVRNISPFGLVAGTILLANVADLWRHRRTTPRTESATAKSSKPQVITAVPVERAADLALAAVFFGRAALTVLGITGSLTGDRGGFGLGEKPWWFGHEAMLFAGQPGFPDRAIVSHIGLAATYEFHNGPERKVYLDPRLEVATQRTFLAQESIMEMIHAGDRRWEIPLRDPQGDLPVVILDSRLSRPVIDGMLRLSGWRLVYADPSAAVFLATSQADALNLPRVEPTPLLSPP